MTYALESRTGSRAVHVAGAALIGMLWLSQAIFAAYIVAHYGGAFLDGTPERWNDSLPRLYEPGRAWQMVGIGLHFLAGAVLIVLVPLQLAGPLRRRFPAVHRWSGRVSVVTAIVAGLGGLSFIVAKGTIGGPVMDAGFALYGALIVLAPVQVYRHARAGRYELHRAWAVRLFALAAASWLYRVEYAAWSIATHRAGRTPTFDGPFDMVMDFFFYAGALAVAEVYLRGRRRTGPVITVASTTVLLVATAGLAAITYLLAVHAWGLAVVERVAGAFSGS